MASLLVLVVATCLLGNLPGIQSRPRQSHGRLYDDMKSVPFVDEQDVTGTAEWDHSDDKSSDSYEDYYKKFNKLNSRFLNDDSKVTDSDNTDVDKDADIDKDQMNIKPRNEESPVEGGIEDMTTFGKISSEDKSESKHMRHHHRREKNSKKRGDKKDKKNKKWKIYKQKAESSIESEDSFDIDRFYKEHPYFKENVATITDNSDKIKKEDLKGGVDSTSENDSDDETEVDNEDDDSDEDEDDSSDDDEDDESNDDDSDDSVDDEDNDGESDDPEEDSKDPESEDDDDDESDEDDDSDDLSSEMFEDYYDYYDELDDSSYSSSEEEAERLGNQMFNDDDWYNQMFGDQPAQSEDTDKSEETKKVESAKIKIAYIENDKTKEPTTTPKAANIKEGSKKGDNIPKTDIEPSTSPNPPTPKKDLKSTVTQPVYPQQKSMLQTWNYIESTPIEACQSDSNCSAGRMCMFGLCLCGQPDFCDGHRKPVCGSDGRLYPSHCELHRTACVLKMHIRIDFTASCMPKTTAGKGVQQMVTSNGANLQTTKLPTAEQTKDVNKIIPVNQAKLTQDTSSESLDNNHDTNVSNNIDEKIELKSIKTENVAKDTAEANVGIGVGEKVVGEHVVDSTDDSEDFNVSDESFEDNDDDEEVIPESLSDSESVSEDVSEEVAGGQVDSEEDSVEIDIVKKDGESEEKVDGATDGKHQSLIPMFCTPDVYLQFKADVLQYHCIFFNEPNCDRQTKEGKLRLAELMFNYFDKNYNGAVENEELWEMQLRENIDELSTLCSLLDIVTFDDVNERDGRLSADEFLKAFDIPDVLEHLVEVVPLLATIGNGLETKCDVTDSEDVVWKRHGIDLGLLDFPGVSVLGDGSLYLETIGFEDVGNLTCYDRKKPSIRQVHMLTVQKPPHVVVSPRIFETNSQDDIVLYCHTEGYPRPVVEWQFDGQTLSQGAKYYIHPHDNTLTIMKVDLTTDSGVYKCLGKNEAGVAEASVTVTLHGPNDTDYKQIEMPEETFIIFHDDGYTMHNPNQCLIQRHVKPDFGNFYFIPDELDAPPALCESGQPCVWGDAVNVQNKFVYASQPRENRVVVVDVQDTFNPNQVILTDKTPVSLYYIEHLDEVWVLCWNGDSDSGTKTVVVIRNASVKTQHHSVHTQPIGNRFDVVNEVFLPPSSELHHPYKFGYTVHNGQQGMFKVDLAQKKYMKAVDLTKHNCVPTAMAFVPLGGHVLIKCDHKHVAGTPQAVLQLDYVTDTVVGNLSESGTPYVTPDVSKVVVVNEDTGKIAVFEVTENGEIKKQFDVSVGPVHKGATFQKSHYSQGYDLYLTSSETSSTMAVNLDNGKMEEIEDVGEPDPSMFLAFFKKTRPLASGDVFSNFLSTASSSSMVILDSKRHNIQCDFHDIQNPVVVSYAHIDRN